jgi:hypothetical protein
MSDMDPIVKPLEFSEAVKKLGSKTAVGAGLSSADWRMVPLAIRERAFFSAKVAEARIASELQSRVMSVATKAEFIAKARPFMLENGFARAENQQDLKAHTSSRRLGLIFEQNTQAARGYGWWKQGQQSDVMDAFPAQEFIRVEARKVPRQTWQARWTAAGGRLWDGRMIALKSDPVWVKLSRFQTPWPPYDFGSGMGVEDVTREEAEALGLMQPGQPAESDEATFDQRVEASTKDIHPLKRDWLMESLRNELGESAVELVGDRVALKNLERPTPSPTVLMTQDQVQQAVATAADRKAAHKALELPEEHRTEWKSKDKIPSGLGLQSKTAQKFLSSVVHKDLVPEYSLVKATPANPRGQFLFNTRVAEVRNDAANIIHEITHAIENQIPGIQKKCSDFLTKRADGKPTQLLSGLTGISDYGLERAWEDSWKQLGGSPYSGKYYSQGGITEVLTMGAQRLYEDPIGFAKNDPEYFSFVISILRKAQP